MSNNWIIAFEAPDFLLKHADARVEHSLYNVIKTVYIQGCKACQRVKSLCKCLDPKIVEKIIYGRELQDGRDGNLDQGLIDTLGLEPGSVPREVKKPQRDFQGPRLTLADLAPLTPDMDFEETGSGKQMPLSEFQDRINPQLIAHLTEVGVNIRFSYPLEKLKEVVELFEKKGRRLTIRPINRKPDSMKRGGLGGVIIFKRPDDMSLLDQYPAAAKCAENPYVLLNDCKLALQLHFDHGFRLDGPEWEPDDKLKPEFKALAV